MAQKTRSMICILLVASMLFVLDIAPAFASSIPAWINSSSATVYNKAGDTGSLKKGTSVEVKAVKKGWAKFDYKGNTGFVRVKYLTAKEGVTAYVKKSAYVYKSASTSSQKYGPLAVGTQLKVVGVNGKFFQVTNGSAYAYIAKSALSKSKPSDTTVLASQVQLVKWSKGKNLFSKGDYVQLYDIMSGITVRVRRLGGSNHAELEPASAEDTAKLLKMSGGKFSWNSRPVILHAGGKFIAAAINTMPHGAQSIKNNNYDGQFCLHLVGSKTHGSNCENSHHQAAIKYAYLWAQTKIS